MSLQDTNAALNTGYAKIGTSLGETCTLYRCTNLLAGPLANEIGSQNIYYDVDPAFSARRVPQYGKPVFYAAMDRSSSQVGDYQVRADGATYFIASMGDLLPTMVVQCNATISLQRPAQTPNAGKTFGYDGDTATVAAATYALDLPVSLLQGTKGEKPTDNLPVDTRNPWYLVLVPAILGLQITSTDQFQDARGQTYSISSVELTALGYRLTAELTSA